MNDNLRTSSQIWHWLGKTSIRLWVQHFQLSRGLDRGFWSFVKGKKIPRKLKQSQKCEPIKSVNLPRNLFKAGPLKTLDIAAWGCGTRASPEWEMCLSMPSTCRSSYTASHFGSGWFTATCRNHVQMFPSPPLIKQGLTSTCPLLYLLQFEVLEHSGWESYTLFQRTYYYNIIIMHYIIYYRDALCNTDHPSALPRAPFQFSPITSPACRLSSKTWGSSSWHWQCSCL